MVDVKKLVELGVHFGHKTSRWHPKMAPYIWGFRNNIHLINVAKTARHLEQAAQFLESVAAEGKTILWVGTKKAAQNTVSEIAQRLNAPCVTYRWIGGTLTNFSQVKKSLTKLLHLEDVVSKSEQSFYTKKELVTLQKTVDRLQKNVGSIRNISWPIGAVVVVDVKKEQTAIKEAATMDIPVVGLVDTNSDPSLIDYVIPCNDDAPKSISFILNYLANAVEKGQEAAKAKPAVEKAKEEEKQEQSAMLAEESEEETTEEEKPTVKKMKKERETTKEKKDPSSKKK